jgi:glycosyltransferase involved in cell wall biosynthesis
VKRVVAALIAGNDIKEDPSGITRCLESLTDYIEVAFILFNGDGDPPELEGNIPKIIWGDMVWEDDFAKARNKSFELVHNYMKLSGEKFDWIMWIDTDDTLEGGENLQSMLDELDPSTQGVFLKYEYAVDPDTGQVLTAQQRERLFRIDVVARWHYPIHEVCHTPNGTQYAKKDSVWIRHQRNPLADRSSTRERNRRILTRAHKESPEVPRFTYYLANEVYAEAAELAVAGRVDKDVANAAIKLYEEFIPVAPSPDDAYIAAHQIAELKRMKGDNRGAIESELQAMMIHPTWSDAYVGIAQCYCNVKDWDKVIFWSDSCLKNSVKAETSQVREPLNDYELPLYLKAIALENKGNLTEALSIYEELDTGAIPEVPLRITEVKGKILDENDKAGLPSPEEDRKRLFGTQPEKSIAFFTRPLFEAWHPKVVKEGGIGGAETCVMEVAKRFAADGWRTVVFGTPGDYRGVDEDGIEWWNSEDWVTTEPFTIFVSSRTPEVFDSVIPADVKLLWMHDVNVGPVFDGPFGDRTKNIDAIIGLTDWHCQHMSKLYNIPIEKFIKIPNGIDLSRFSDEQKKKKKTFVWSSSPDRGLDVVMRLWGPIRERWPDAELHIYYGWNSINKILEIHPDHPLQSFKAHLMGVIEDLGGEGAGIYWHDRVGQQQLARELEGYEYWLYPTYFMETFCITALEMQAAGVIPLVNNIAALNETVAHPYSKLWGWPNNESFMTEFLGRLYVLDTQPKKKKEIYAAGREHASKYTWDNAYSLWQMHCDHIVNHRLQEVAT